jgi:CubicO group peptidase (beta-lactamase class C family)
MRLVTRVRGSTALLLVAYHLAAFPASAQEATRDTSAPSPGLWMAKQRFGPDARGRLLLIRDGGAWRAELAGHRIAARAAADTISFALPDSLGSFIGRLSRDHRTVAGHWVQPRTVAAGNPYASPLRLHADGANRWAGEVVPLDDEMTLFLRITRRPDGTLGAFIRNPERNLGRQLRVDRIERHGSDVSLVGKRNGGGQERVLGRGALSSAGFSLDFDGRGTYEFHRVGEGEHSDFYPRGRPTGSYSYRPPPQLNDGWPVGTLESAGLSTDTISAFIRALINASMDSLGAQQVHALLIARHGTLVLEEYFHGNDRDKPHDTRSASKSMTATLAGAAIHAGVGGLSLSSPVYAIMNGGTFPADIEPRKRTITLEHFLSMSSGIDCDDNDDNSPGNENTMLDGDEPDYYALTLRLKTIRDPGTKAVYCSVQPNLVGGAIARAAHRPLTDLFDELVAEPLGIRHYYLNLSPTGAPYMGGGMRFTARDFAKFGQLYLNGGTWRGRRILDRSFVERASTPRFAMGGIHYGLLWWVMDYPFRGDTVQAYFAGGNGGQLVMVIPRLNMVVAAFAANYQDATSLKIQRQDVPTYILPAVRAQQ